MILPRSSPQKLRVYRPTPTTVSFTVSTRSLPTTLPAQALQYLALTCRVLVGFFILALVFAKWKLTCTYQREEEGPLYLRLGSGRHASDVWPQWMDVRTVWEALQWIAGYAEWRFLLPASLAGLWAVVRRGYTEESLLVLRGLGVQTSSSTGTYLSTSITRFIPTTSIQDIFIHEAFKGFEVRFYLAIVVEGEEDVVVVFPNLLPKRQILEEVWRGTRACLYEPKK